MQLYDGAIADIMRFVDRKQLELWESHFAALCVGNDGRRWRRGGGEGLRRRKGGASSRETLDEADSVGTLPMYLHTASKRSVVDDECVVYLYCGCIVHVHHPYQSNGPHAL